jgi:hypothetical protein
VSRVTRAALISVSLLLATFAAGLALLAADVDGARSALRQGDARFASTPADSFWTDHSATFGGVARTLLGIGDDIRYRQALQLYRSIPSAAASFDSGQSRSIARGIAQAALSRVEQTDRNPVRASRAATLLALLALSGGGTGAADQAVAELQNAIRLDESDTDAKFDLELLLRMLFAHGVRQGQGSGATGRSFAHRGAGLGTPGEGY